MGLRGNKWSLTEEREGECGSAGFSRLNQNGDLRQCAGNKRRTGRGPEFETGRWDMDGSSI